MSGLSRRQFVGGGTAAVAVGASLARAQLAQAQSGVPEPLRGSEGGTIPGPMNTPIDRENPDLLLPPSTDAGLLPNLKFSMSDAHMHLLEGGWSRQVNVQQLPIATTLTGVEMRLDPGAIRELHWRQQGEWALMLSGRAQITAIDDHGRNFIADVGEGDLWFFRRVSTLDSGSEAGLRVPARVRLGRLQRVRHVHGHGLLQPHSAIRLGEELRGALERVRSPPA